MHCDHAEYSVVGYNLNPFQTCSHNTCVLQSTLRFGNKVAMQHEGSQRMEQDMRKAYFEMHTEFLKALLRHMLASGMEICSFCRTVPNWLSAQALLIPYLKHSCLLIICKCEILTVGLLGQRLSPHAVWLSKFQVKLEVLWDWLRS